MDSEISKADGFIGHAEISSSWLQARGVMFTHCGLFVNRESGMQADAVLGHAEYVLQFREQLGRSRSRQAIHGLWRLIAPRTKGFDEVCSNYPGEIKHLQWDLLIFILIQRPTPSCGVAIGCPGFPGHQHLASATVSQS